MKHNVLFVCWGNICRSPSAEAVFKKKVKDAGFDAVFNIDSAGTISAHVGEPADYRMRKHAALRGLKLDSLSRKIDPKADFDRFDYIVAMDDNNYRDLCLFARDKSDIARISKMTDYCRISKHSSIPDPYYGGDEGFELVLDILDDACSGLLKYIMKK